VDDVRAFGVLAWAWTRAAWQYRASLVLLTIGQCVAVALDVVAILIIFIHTDALAGFSATEVLFLYGTTCTSFGIAEVAMGQVDRLGQHIRSGSFDVMLVRPASTLVQVMADGLSPKRLGKLVPAAIALGVSVDSLEVTWSADRIAMVVVLLTSGVVIYCAIWVLGAAFQFIATDAAEAVNAVTYGGNYLTQYPLTVFGTEWVRTLTWVVPLAFVNWYPALYVFDRPDPFGFPYAAQFAAPVVAVAVAAVATLAWRVGLRRYRSTGS
jgi:ABC-2 type transport system permease protein